ncbi:hypothetical protein [Luteibacter sp. 3190]|uniref:hypothetical protein n=1 Tax=Luteibacter sp. 3190 TaxID=2817736 RepID=UPI00286665CC|nr:hypothetical protein [Luteibacter sp. 3190]MDR6935151.1 hypothetical protein [Luteibacter sp. 3190]
MLHLLEGDPVSARRRLETARSRESGAAVRDHIEKLLSNLGEPENTSAAPDANMTHFLLSDYLSGQTRH